jgi:hypothetical protein
MECLKGTIFTLKWWIAEDLLVSIRCLWCAKWALEGLWTEKNSFNDNSALEKNVLPWK